MQPQQQWVSTTNNSKNLVGNSTNNLIFANLNLTSTNPSQNRRASPNVLEELQNIQHQQQQNQQYQQQQQQKIIQSFSAPTTPTNLSSPSSPVNSTPLHQTSSKLRKRKRDRVPLNMSSQDGDWVFKNETKESIMNPESFREPVVTREIPSNINLKSNSSGEFEVLHWRINKSQQQFQQQLIQHLNSQPNASSSSSSLNDTPQPIVTVQQPYPSTVFNSNNPHETAISKLISKLAQQQPTRRNSAPAPYQKPSALPLNISNNNNNTAPISPSASMLSNQNLLLEASNSSASVNWEQLYRDQSTVLQQTLLEKQKLEEQLVQAKINWDQLLEQTKRREEMIQSQQQQISTLKNTIDTLIEKSNNGTLIRKSISLQQLSPHPNSKIEDLSSKLIYDFQQLNTSGSGASSRSSTPSTSSSGPSSLSAPSTMPQISLLLHQQQQLLQQQQPYTSSMSQHNATTSSAPSLLFLNNTNDDDTSTSLDTMFVDNTINTNTSHFSYLQQQPQSQALQGNLQNYNTSILPLPPQSTTNNDVEQEPDFFEMMGLDSSVQSTPNFLDGMDMNYLDPSAAQQNKRRKIP